MCTYNKQIYDQLFFIKFWWTLRNGFFAPYYGLSYYLSGAKAIAYALNI
jgi:hypothetical protein